MKFRNKYLREIVIVKISTYRFLNLFLLLDYISDNIFKIKNILRFFAFLLCIFVKKYNKFDDFYLVQPYIISANASYM